LAVKVSKKQQKQLKSKDSHFMKELKDEVKINPLEAIKFIRKNRKKKSTDRNKTSKRDSLEKSVFELIPFKRMEDLNLVTKDDEFVLYLKLNTQNINQMTDDQKRLARYKLTFLMRSYSREMNWISMNYPSDLQSNIDYFHHCVSDALSKGQQTRAMVAKKHLLYLIQASKLYKDVDFYIQIFATDQDDLRVKTKLISDLCGLTLGGKPLHAEKTKKILRKMFNMNTEIKVDSMSTTALYGGRSKLSMEDVKAYEEKGYDFTLHKQIQPQIKLQGEGRYLRAGDGVYQCLTFYELPERPAATWQWELFNIPNSIVLFSFSEPQNDVILKNINKSLFELSDKIQDEQNVSDQMNAAKEYELFMETARKINDEDEVMLYVCIRVYLSGNTHEEIDETVKNLMPKLKAKGYGGAAHINKQIVEHQALFQPYYKQFEATGNKGIAIPTSVIGGGYAFNYQKLVDPRGGYLGETDTGGPVAFDYFHVDDIRTAFSMFIFGKSGTGKSATQKKIVEILYAQEVKIRIFEKNKDWLNLIEQQEAPLLSLGGGETRINPFEPLAAVTDNNGNLDEYATYLRHRTNFFNIVRFLYTGIDSVEILEYSSFLDDFYVHCGLLPANYIDLYDVTDSTLIPEELRFYGKPAHVYPTARDFEYFLESYFKLPKFNDALEAERMGYKRFSKVIHSMAYQYSRVFNGHTTASNLDDLQTLAFDINSLDGLPEHIKAAQIFSTLALIGSQVLKNGLHMKRLIAEGKIKPEDVVKFILVLDECQNLIQEKYEFIVDALLEYVAEWRKFGGGVMFATHFISTVFPSDSQSVYADKVKKLLGFCQAKLFFRTDITDVSLLKKVIGTALTDVEYAQLPYLKKGEFFAHFDGHSTYKVQTVTSDEDLIFYGGGR